MAAPAQKIALGPAFAWMRAKEARALVTALGAENCRFVGGAVRDSIIGRAVVDVDVATLLAPEFVIKRLTAAGIKPLPTGLKHGTVTALFNDRHFEITTLRHDVETFGRHATVAFHDDWQGDAARRDFTINALYLAPDGTLYDYFGGAADLRAGRVRFIGDAGTRITEDGLRILRLFRFHAWFGKGALDRAGLAAVREKIDMLEMLSPERIRDETFKLLAAPDPVPVLKAMERAGVLGHVLEGYSFDYRRLARVVALEDQLSRVSALRRLGAFLKLRKEDAEAVFHRFHLSNKERKRLADLAGIGLPARLDQKAIRKIMYRHGRAAFEDALILNAKDKAGALAALKIADETAIPEFPVSGRDLETLGLKPGVAMGRKLKELEARWIDSDFALTKATLLKIL